MAIIPEHKDYSLAPFSLEGQSAIVTGSGSGIGRATARLFASAGAKVVLGDIDIAAARVVVDEIADAGGAALAVECDISDEAQVKAMFAAALGEYGQVDVLASVAAYRKKHDTMRMSPEEWDIMQAVTARGTFLCMREAIRVMREAGVGGTIVNVSSVASIRPVVFNSMDYDAAKAGVNAMTLAAAAEFAEHGIRVNAVLPGGTNSAGAGKMGDTSVEQVSIHGPITQPGRVLVDRMAEPIEQARAILFLASPASSYITGQLLAVEGGVLLS
ncbi:MAG: SDR family NAD(P)-dependent oxidoreductase [Novosphingobium sp.]|nr:SDR family NAD(P)-dependent oxidoreductase [Novosphingobium sp.]